MTTNTKQEWRHMLTAIPKNGDEFLMSYKDILFKCRREDNFIFGESMLGELKLNTTLTMIYDHDVENQTFTKWRKP